MEVGQGPSWGCSTKETKYLIHTSQKTMRPYSEIKLVNAVQVTDSCLFSESRKSVHKLKSFLMLKHVVLLRMIFHRYVTSGVINTFKLYSFVYATIRKDVGSIPDKVIEFLN
jgi:hypothetical protein